MRARNTAGLTLNISEHSNALDLDLAREVAERFRVNEKTREAIIKKASKAVSCWHEVAARMGIPRNQIEGMKTAFTAASSGYS